MNNKIDKCKRFIAENSEDIDAWLNLGDAYYENTNYDEAINCYKKVALELDPFSSEAWNNLGLVY